MEDVHPQLEKGNGKLYSINEEYQPMKSSFHNIVSLRSILVIAPS